VPELPETETIARDLDRAVSGATIAGVRVQRVDVLRDITAAALSRRVIGARIERSYRRAKTVVILLDTNDRIVVQPRFTGALLVDDGSLPAEALSYLTVLFALRDGRTLAYRDIRRLGTLTASLAPLRLRPGIFPIAKRLEAQIFGGIRNRGRRRGKAKQKKRRQAHQGLRRAIDLKLGTAPSASYALLLRQCRAGASQCLRGDGRGGPDRHRL